MNMCVVGFWFVDVFLFFRVGRVEVWFVVLYCLECCGVGLCCVVVWVWDGIVVVDFMIDMLFVVFGVGLWWELMGMLVKIDIECWYDYSFGCIGFDEL